jgi:hypothetical protein
MNFIPWDVTGFTFVSCSVQLVHEFYQTEVFCPSICWNGLWNMSLCSCTNCPVISSLVLCKLAQVSLLEYAGCVRCSLAHTDWRDGGNLKTFVTLIVWVDNSHSNTDKFPAHFYLLLLPVVFCSVHFIVVHIAIRDSHNRPRILSAREERYWSLVCTPFYTICWTYLYRLQIKWDYTN